MSQTGLDTVELIKTREHSFPSQDIFNIPINKKTSKTYKIDCIIYPDVTQTEGKGAV